MNNSFPTALVVGIDLMAGKELVEELLKNEINVLGMGEYIEIANRENFEYRLDFEEIDRKINYIFDLTGNRKVFEIAKRDGSRVVIIGEEGEVDNEVNWRRLVIKGIYGGGMEKEESNKWLVGMIGEAVKNKNLTVPSRKSEIRLLPISDWVGVVIKTCFVSGIDREKIEIWGRKVGIEDLVAKLIDKAKMTRFKVMETDEIVLSPSDEEVMSEWRKIRWEPNEDWSIDLEKTLQYFFTLADEESRKGKNVIRNPISDIRNTNPSPGLPGSPLDPPEAGRQGDITNKKKFEAMVEEEENVISNPISDIRNTIDDISSQNPSVSNKLETPPLDKGGRSNNDLEEFEIKPIVVKKKENKNDISNTIYDKRNLNPTPFAALRDLPLTGEVDKQEEFEIKPLISPLPERKVVRNQNPSPDKSGSPLDPPEAGRQGGRKKITVEFGKYLKMIAGGVVIAIVLMGVIGVVDYVLAIDSWLKTVKSGKTAEIIKVNERLEKKTEKLIDNWESWGWNNNQSGRKYWKGLKLIEEATEVVSLGTELSSSGEKIGEGVFLDKDIELIKELDLVEEKMVEIQKKLGLIQAEMSTDWAWIPGRWRPEISKLKKLLPEYREKIDHGIKAIPVVKEMLGGDGKRREYLVLFQNESELRPGGGFIGSFGVVSFENGKMLGMEVKDIYEIDGQLKGHVEPPEAIKNILGEGGWYLRDANWKPNMIESSKDILWFFEKETGRRVDGVVMMNLAVAKAWLGVLGEVMVPDFKVKINKDNLYEQAEFYAETKFFPGSNQKGSFLGGLATVMMEEIKTAKGLEKIKLLEASLNALEENELQIVLSEKKINNVLTELGWNGAMYQGKCKDNRCVADYWFGVEANLGVNKANYFIYRNIEQQAEINSNAVARVARITYENTAKNSNWPGGDYKNYMRIYIPAEANLAEVSVTGNDGTKTVYGGDSLKINTVDGKKEVGFLVVVPVASKRILEVRYNLPIDMSKDNKFSYMLYQQRQSGYGDTGLVNLITIPSGWQVSQVEPAATVMGNKLLFNQKFKKDLMVGVEIEK